MNLEKFTDRAKGFLQAAQTVAIRMNHQRISPSHLLKALLDDSEGMAAQLIQRAGGNPGVAITEVDNALAKVPAVSGGGFAATTPFFGMKERTSEAGRRARLASFWASGVVQSARSSPPVSSDVGLSAK